MGNTASDKVLIVGAGAVGQVYGLHMQRGGASVAVFVKDKYAEAARQGYTLHRVRRAATRFVPDTVVSDAAGVEEQGPWDQVWLCMSSTALQGWKEAGAVLRAAGPRATVLCLTTGIEDVEFVSAKIGGLDRLVEGLITMISWHAPLPGQQVDPAGVAYWLPPGAAPPFSGDATRVGRLVTTLKKGGYRAKVVKSVRTRNAFGAATLLPLMAGLEMAAWSFKTFRKGRWLGVATRAGREGHAIAASRLGVRHAKWLSAIALNPTIVGFIAWIAPWFVPFPLETYLKEHFTKVGDQTRSHLRRYLELAEEHTLPCVGLRELREGLGDDVG